jgi:uncharacterized protein (DUF608 family)
MDHIGRIKKDGFSENVNELRKGKLASGIYMHSGTVNSEAANIGSMSLVTTEEDISAKPSWIIRYWWHGDGAQEFWDDFRKDGLLGPVVEEIEERTEKTPNTRIGSICLSCELQPGQEKDFQFIITWFFPNRVKNWNEDNLSNGFVKNHYCNLFDNAWNVGEYTVKNLERLEAYSRKFSNALFESTLPDYVLEAVAANITVLRSPTCFWLEDGSFLGWEGSLEKYGSGAGSCTHVWNYAQTPAFLFPSLERSMRKIEFNLETDEQGKMSFRTFRILGLEPWGRQPAADGQMGAILRLYREWKLSGDNEFLKSVWSGAKRALEFAFSYWDTDGDMVLDSRQHNTYDIDFIGPNSLVNSLFYGALKAASEMAEALGDLEASEKYYNAFKAGSRKMDELLWNGEYYIQKIEDENIARYQYGKGCLSDQVFGQLMCHMAGLGYILPKEHVKKALQSVVKYNFRKDFYLHNSVQRTYIFNDEQGLLVCSWPKGGRPRFPFLYSDEVWTGIEYQVAAHLIFEGYVDEGLLLVKAVRDRHDGYKRNPWNEVECGYHYARSMSSWAVLIALSGFRYDLVNKRIGFFPKINCSDFSTFWSTGTAWGTYSRKWDERNSAFVHNVDVLYGSLEDVEIITDADEW